jgi:predicted nucleotidyltransferase
MHPESRAMAVQVPIDRNRIEEFCRKWRVKELAIFGSAVRQDFGPDSDVDVLVELQPEHHLSLYDWVDMTEELREIFGRKVDLVGKGGLKNPFRRREILRTAEVVYAA